MAALVHPFDKGLEIIFGRRPGGGFGRRRRPFVRWSGPVAALRCPAGVVAAVAGVHARSCSLAVAASSRAGWTRGLLVASSPRHRCWPVLSLIFFGVDPLAGIGASVVGRDWLRFGASVSGRLFSIRSPSMRSPLSRGCAASSGPLGALVRAIRVGVLYRPACRYPRRP